MHLAKGDPSYPKGVLGGVNWAARPVTEKLGPALRGYRRPLLFFKKGATGFPASAWARPVRIILTQQWWRVLSGEGAAQPSLPRAPQRFRV